MSLENRIRTRVESLFREIQRQLSNQREWGALAGVSLIGPPPTGRSIERIMDFDLVIVTERDPTRDTFAAIDRWFANLCARRQPGIDVSYTIADGPIKPIPENDCELFFHVLLHSVQSYNESPLRLVKTSWQHEGLVLYGQPLHALQRLSPPSFQDVLDGPLGIRHCLSLIQAGASQALKWRPVVGGQLQLLPTHVQFREPRERLEMCYYAALRCASNALRASLGVSAGIGIREKDMRLFAQVFRDSREASTPMMSLEAKHGLRRAVKEPTVSDVEAAIEQTGRLLEDLDRRMRCEGGRRERMGA